MKGKILLLAICVMLVSLSGYCQTYVLNFDQPFGTTSWSEDGFSWSWDNSGWDNIRNYSPHSGSGHAMSASNYASKLSAANNLLNINSIWVQTGMSVNFSYFMIKGYDINGTEVYSITLNPNLYEFSYAKVTLNWTNVKSIKIDYAAVDEMSPAEVYYDDMEYSISCFPHITVQSSVSAHTGSNGQFSASASVPTAVYQWQSKPADYGWVNVPVNATYTGSATNALTINNVKVSNHLQPFRLITTRGICVDTSSVGILTVTDTCINTITNTVHISVTDTLIINAVLTGITPPNNVNKIKIYPNPAFTHIYIDNGNYSSMSGYIVRIENNLGQPVYQSLLNQQLLYVDLSSWSGGGLYMVYIKDNLGNTIDTKKIILQ